MRRLATIREIELPSVRVVVDAVEEDSPDFSLDESGEILRGVESGKFVLFCARVRVFVLGNEVGTDYLGNCIYNSFEEFGRDQYCRDMVGRAIVEARDTIKTLQRIHVR